MRDIAYITVDYSTVPVTYEKRYGYHFICGYDVDIETMDTSKSKAVAAFRRVYRQRMKAGIQAIINK